MRSRAREVLPPSKLRERRKRARVWRAILICACLAMLLAGAIGAFYLPAVTIAEVRVEGAHSIASEAIAGIVERGLSGRRFLILPKRNALIYPREGILAQLRAEHPKLKTIAMSLSGLKTLSVSVSERAPYARFCGATPSPDAACFFMDETGVVYEPSPSFSDNPYVDWYGGEPLAPGQRFLTQEEFSLLRPLADAFKGEGLTVRSIAVDDVRDVHVYDATGAEVRFALTRKPEDVLRALRAARASEALAGKELSEIEYIDLRFGNRLYYRLR